jgi:hypothetical protein
MWPGFNPAFLLFLALNRAPLSFAYVAPGFSPAFPFSRLDFLCLLVSAFYFLPSTF